LIKVSLRVVVRRGEPGGGRWLVGVIHSVIKGLSIFNGEVIIVVDVQCIIVIQMGDQWRWRLGYSLGDDR
jgi:hypothetical protein